MLRAKKLRLRRKAKQRKRQVEDISVSAGENFDKHFSNRLNRLLHVKRFVLGWLTLVVLLSGVAVLQTRSLGNYYLQPRPVHGGTYTEGLSGALTNVNPLFVSGVVDSTVSKLVFSGLLKYDTNNNLVGDLAESWSLDDDGTTYTVKLKQNLKWHDGAKLTSEDVVFTFKLAQNADVKSPLFNTWKNVKINAVDEHTVTFELSSIFAPFEQSFTSGILPAHLLRNTQPEQLRSSSFNSTNPVGSGPYTWQTVELAGSSPDDRQQSIGLKAYEDYHFGKPKIENYVIKTFVDEESLIKAYQEQRVDAMVGLNQIPEEAKDNSFIYEIPTTAISFAFFDTKNDSLKDKELRKALVQSANKEAIFDALGYPVIPADSPLLRSSIAYNTEITQDDHSNLEAAKETLKKAKYKLGPDGFILNDGEELELRIIGENNHENNVVSRILQQNWSELGIKTEVILQEEQDIRATISSDSRSYDVLLHSISIGHGPDVYAFWHSSQQDIRSPRLNFSNYTNETVDAALDSGRSRLDEKLRIAKYKPFLENWVADNPALALYQPRFLHISRTKIFNYENRVINTSVDRLSNVHEWMIRKQLVKILE